MLVRCLKVCRQVDAIANIDAVSFAFKNVMRHSDCARFGFVHPRNLGCLTYAFYNERRQHAPTIPAGDHTERMQPSVVPAGNPAAPRSVTFKDVKSNPKVRKLIEGANEVMRAMGYTEHGLRHVDVVSGITGFIMVKLELSPRQIELGRIAAYLHDCGNIINRVNHPLHGAVLAFNILDEMGMDASEIAPILGAIGNHEGESGGIPVSSMSAALIIADKSDVHFTRVQNPTIETFDIHDRVNFAVQKSRVDMDQTNRVIELNLEIDTKQATVMEYFEIFLSRMVMCRVASESLGYRFTLRVNGTYLE